MPVGVNGLLPPAQAAIEPMTSSKRQAKAAARPRLRERFFLAYVNEIATIASRLAKTTWG